LLKLTPVLALGGVRYSEVAGRSAEKRIGLQRLGGGAAFSVRPSGDSFDDAELTPPPKFPINGYDVDDPGVDLENWTLAVSGAVQKRGNINWRSFKPFRECGRTRATSAWRAGM